MLMVVDMTGVGIMARADKTKRYDCWELDGHRFCTGFKGRNCVKCKDQQRCKHATMTKKQAEHYGVDVLGNRRGDWGATQGAGSKQWRN